MRSRHNDRRSRHAGRVEPGVAPNSLYGLHDIANVAFLAVNLGSSMPGSGRQQSHTPSHQPVERQHIHRLARCDIALIVVQHGEAIRLAHAAQNA